MAILSSQAKFCFQILPRFSENKKPLLVDSPISEFPLNRTLFKRMCFHVSAHTGRHSARRNSLRIKLTQNLQLNLIRLFELHNPDKGFSVMDDSGSSLDFHGVKESGFIYKDSDDVVNVSGTIQKSEPKHREGGNYVDEIPSLTLQPNFFPKLSRVGVALFCGSLVFWMVMRLFRTDDGGVKMTRLEKEMLRRKMKARKERSVLERGSVEVIQESIELPVVLTKRPQIDRQEIMNTITNANMTGEKSSSKDSFGCQSSESAEMHVKIEEIREIASQACSSVTAEIDNRLQNVELPSDEIDGVTHKMPGFLEYPESNADELCGEAASVNNGHMQASGASNTEVKVATKADFEAVQHTDTSFCISDSTKPKHLSDAVDGRYSLLGNSPIGGKPRIIRSVKEAKEYLSRKNENNGSDNQQPLRGSDGNAKLQLGTTKNALESLVLSDRSDFDTPANVYEYFSGEDQPASTETDGLDLAEKQSTLGVKDPNPKGVGESVNVKPSVAKEDWVEKNVEELKPFFEKIQLGFRDNFALARENANPELYVNSHISDHINEGDDEFEWMKDEDLRKIVYQVRENELAGRDPFCSMDAEQKLAFFSGLQKKIEKVNKNMLKVHEWVHSNVENIDYGADGISLYDPIEKIVPRWKGPPIASDPEFLSNYKEQRKAFAPGGNEKSSTPKMSEQKSLQKSESSLSKPKFHDKVSKTSKTVIESSDGSAKAGKKSGKEYWQHTKKRSRGFFEVYNAESDPEIKSELRNVGKDLDRWITEKEIKEAGDLMNGLHKRKKEFIGKRIHKLRREIEQFGPQAVVDKYREYAEEKEEDYLWWLDLPFILCIKLYMHDNGDQRIGLYTLEMAPDLELNPKPQHVIAFQDPVDCRNLCYIIQAHLEMLGNGHAFVTALPPRDAFREAKANGSNVTVIRKRELVLNADQQLEEVEEMIIEMGSKFYHDKIMRERSVDLSTLTNGVFGSSSQPNSRKELKRLLKKRAKRTGHRND